MLLEIREYCPEVLQKVKGLVDGDIRRETDAIKVLCLGARRVGIGRAVLFGLGVGGVAGVQRTLESKTLKNTCFQRLPTPLKYEKKS